MDKIKEITWGTFTPLHFFTIFLIIPVTFGIYFLLRKRSEKTQTIVLFLLSLIGMSSLVGNMVLWHSPLENLPLHLCSINAMLIPVAILSRNKVLSNLLPVYSIGALSALLLNQCAAGYKICSLVFFMYYVPHMLDFAIPCVLVMLHRTEPSPKYIIPSVGITFGLYTAVHFCNVLLNNYFAAHNVLNYRGELITVNYMFSIRPAGNPLLEFCWKLVPYRYYYMMVLMPIIALAFFIANLSGIIKLYKEKKSKQNQQKQA